MEQGIYDHPDVAGWKAYYQEPLFDRVWVNNVMLPKRQAFMEALVKGGTVNVGGSNVNFVAIIPVLLITIGITNASDPNVLIDTFAERMFNYPITTAQRTALKDFLIPGLPDFEWTVEYNSLLANPTDTALQQSVNLKLQNLVAAMCQMAEFQIM